jgi:2-keto-4-pentenoate hydratase/2-oxohepta-3-ene-1,7-dioic acid hydratase in catechol pathway
MKFTRFEADGKVAYGIIKSETVTEISAAPFGAYDKTGNEYPLSQVKLLAPCEPSKVLATALNYKSHLPHIPGITGSAAPTQPELFYKVPSSIINPGDTIVLPADVRPVEEEAELVVVIGKSCKNVSVDQAMDYVFGYTCGNDVSARPWQRGDKQWWRAKSSDTFTPFGPWIETDLDESKLDIWARINGKEVQYCNSAELLFDIPTIISFVSQVVTLEPGDLIYTGTSGTPAELEDGDVVDVEVAGIGVLSNPVKRAK